MALNFVPAMRVGSYDYGSPFTQAFDNTGGSTGNLPLYSGRAFPNASKAAAVWQIYKIFYDANDSVSDIKWASGSSDFQFIWNSRAGYVYS